jgi:hypothetical protein
LRKKKKKNTEEFCNSTKEEEKESQRKHEWKERESRDTYKSVLILHLHFNPTVTIYSHILI